MTDGGFRPPHAPLVPPGGIECFARDMTAIISADVTLAAAQIRLAELSQWLPIDGDPQITVGELVERNSTGPLRLGYGAWRDLLLGAQFQNGRGELITAGGRAVKNVAGYDLTKFMVGQRGVFGRLVTITTRTYRRPAGALVAQFAPDIAWIGGLFPSPLRPQWIILKADALVCGYVSDERTLAYYEQNLAQHQPRSVMRRSLEADIADRAALWREADFRAAIPPDRIPEFIKQAGPRQWLADPAFGVIKIFGAGDEAQLRQAATSAGGSIFRESGNFNLRGFYNPTQKHVLKQLKQAFDPDGKLAPLELE